MRAGCVASLWLWIARWLAVIHGQTLNDVIVTSASANRQPVSERAHECVLACSDEAPSCFGRVGRGNGRGGTV